MPTIRERRIAFSPGIQTKRKGLSKLLGCAEKLCCHAVAQIAGRENERVRAAEIGDFEDDRQGRRKDIGTPGGNTVEADSFGRCPHCQVFEQDFEADQRNFTREESRRDFRFFR